MAKGIIVGADTKKFLDESISVTQYKSYDTSYNLLSEILPDGMLNKDFFMIDVIFENNTSNSRAGEYISYAKKLSNTFSSVKRIGNSEYDSPAYGVDVYSGCTIKIRYSYFDRLSTT